MKNKLYAAKEYAELSFQFYRDEKGTPNFLITCNPKKEGQDFCTGVDTLIFAINLVENPMLSVNEVVFLCNFFDKVRNALKDKVSTPK